MAILVSELLRHRCVAVASGGAFEQFELQFLAKLPTNANFSNLFLFPTNCASGYYYDNKLGRFQKAYDIRLGEREVKCIFRSFQAAFDEMGYVQPERTYGAILENRGSQVTFSALGQKAPLHLKERWDPHQRKRQRIRKLLKKYLPGFEISIGGTTSIDVTKKGVNKTLCVKKLQQRLHIGKKDMLYVGDALFKGGNDYIMKSAKITCAAVSNAEATKRLIRRIIASDK